MWIEGRWYLTLMCCSSSRCPANLYDGISLSQRIFCFAGIAVVRWQALSRAIRRPIFLLIMLAVNSFLDMFEYVSCSSLSFMPYGHMPLIFGPWGIQNTKTSEHKFRTTNDHCVIIVIIDNGNNYYSSADQVTSLSKITRSSFVTRYSFIHLSIRSFIFQLSYLDVLTT